MTANGGLAAAFNGTTSQTLASSAAKTGTNSLTGTVGQAWGTGVSQIVSRFTVYAPNNSLISTSSNANVLIVLRGSTDNFATSAVTLCTVGPAGYSAGSEIDVQTGIDISTAYPYHQIEIIEQAGNSASHTIAVAQAIFYTQLNSGFCQRGIATAVFEYNYGTDSDDFLATWGQVERPSAYFVAKGVAIYDPRDPTQNLYDETTWKMGVNNASLVQATYLTRDYGGRVPKDKILWDKVACAANYDDEVIGCLDGTFIKRYTIDGVVTLDIPPYQIMPQLLTANRGYVLESAGNVWVSSSRPQTPIATIHDGILSGAITYQAAKAKRDLINKLQVRFVATEQDYQVVDGPILNRTDLIASDGETLPGTLTLNYTQDYRRAERLQKAYLESSRLGGNITCTVTTDLLALVDDELIGSVVTFDSCLFSGMNGTYFITSVGFADDFSTISLAMTEYDATIETDWNTATDEAPFTLAPIS